MNLLCLTAVIYLVGCGRLPPPQDVGTTASLHESNLHTLGLSGALMRDGSPLDQNSIGSEVQIAGFAREQDGVPLIWRGMPLALCGGEQGWPDDVEGQWVRAWGVLEEVSTCDPAHNPVVEMAGCSRFRLEACKYQVGATESDIVPMARNELVQSKIFGRRPRIGDNVDGTGVLYAPGSRLVVRVGGLDLEVRCSSDEPPCEQCIVDFEGSIGYHPPLLSLEMLDALQIPSATLAEGWYTIDDCNLTPVSMVRD